MTPAPVIRLHPDDGVLIARSSLPPGMVIEDGVTTIERIPAGHKVAVRPIAVGEPVRPDGVQARVAQEELGSAARRGVATGRRVEVLAQSGPPPVGHSVPPARSELKRESRLSQGDRRTGSWTGSARRSWG